MIDQHTSLVLVALTYDGSRIVGRTVAPLAPGRLGPWTVAVQRTPLADGERIEVLAHAAEAIQDSGIAVELDLSDWREDWYLHVPGAVYAGNRFPSLVVPYSPRLPADLATPQAGTFISRVSRLECQGAGSIHLLSGDTAAPLIALRAPDGRGLVLRCAQGFAGRDHGLSILESSAHDRLTLRLAAPGVRERRYHHMDADAASSDRGLSGPAGTAIRLAFTLRRRQLAQLSDLFAWLGELRGDLAIDRAVPPQLPLSAAADLIGAHYERDNWREQPGYWATDPDPQSRYPWQTGWCGGLINSRALIAHPDAQLREHARRTVTTVLTQGVAPSGLLWGKHTRELGWCADFAHDAARPWTQGWTLVRRQGDALYYLLRTLADLELRGEAVPESWLPPIRGMAEAFCTTWERDGQLGQFLDQRSGAVAVGGSTSAAIVPGALILAWQRFGVARFRHCAEAIALDLQAHVECGYTTGGPGDALQCPDSESVAALVESLAALWNATGEARWLNPLAQAADLAATWVMDADYPYPSESAFGRLGLGSIGTVFANVQNKHSAPGICTHSGLGLLTLHRATQDPRPLALLSAIARALPHFVSRVDRPIIAQNGIALPAGWINERVNTSDWDDNLGGVFYGSTWCEVSLLLTWAELPSLYLRRDTGALTIFDHLEARWESGRLHVRNPTAFPARIRLLVEDAAAAARPCGPAGIGLLPEVLLAAGETRIMPA